MTPKKTPLLTIYTMYLQIYFFQTLNNVILTTNAMQQPTTNNQQPTTNNQQQTTNKQWPTPRDIKQ